MQLYFVNSLFGLGLISMVSAMFFILGCLLRIICLGIVVWIAAQSIAEFLVSWRGFVGGNTNGI